MNTLNEPLLKQIFQEARQNHQRVKAHYQKTGYEKRYPLGTTWIDNLKGLINILRNEEDPQKKIAKIHETVMYSVNTGNAEIKRLMVAWYEDYFKKNNIKFDELAPEIVESPYSSQHNTIQLNGRTVSPDFLRTVLICLEMKKHCSFPDRRISVLELGAGYGGLARTLRLFFPNTCTVISDIPETLYFSYLFLRLNFPEARFCYVTDPGSFPKSIQEYDLVFIPTMFADQLQAQRFHLFYNTASLGEMRNEAIRQWMDFVQNKIEVNYFFGLNRYFNAINPKFERVRLDENECSVLFDPAWSILSWELDPPMARCPYLETLVSRNLKIIAQRIPKNKLPQKSDMQRQSEKLIENISKEDWFTNPMVRNQRISFGSPRWPLTNTRADRLLTPDLTQAGTLFFLWESIRLFPSERNVAMMLQYIEVLEGTHPFEERFYYEKLFKKLAGRAWKNSKRVPLLANFIIQMIKKALR